MNRFDDATVQKLQQVTDKLRVGRVCGDRILVMMSTPRTDMDGVEERSGLHIPADIKKKNTPLPSTGVIAKCGPEATGFHEGEAVMFSPYAGSNVSEGGIKDKYRILSSNEILSTLVPAEGYDIGDVIKLEEVA